MITLIIPCFNSERYLSRCLKSVLDQTEKNLQIIIVDDGSTDQTSQIIKDYVEKLNSRFTEVEVITQENAGVGAACAAAYKMCKGKYLILLDSDDILLPDSIRKQSQFLENHPEYALVRTNGFYVKENDLNQNVGLFEDREEIKVKTEIFMDVFRSNVYNWPGSYMVRCSVLEEYYPDKNIIPSRYGQNLQFLLTSAHGNKAGFIDEPLMKYTIRNNSLSHFSGPNVKEKELRAFDGYKEIRSELIATCFDNDSMLKLENEKLYIRVKSSVAGKYRDISLLKQQLDKCNQYNLNQNDEIRAYVNSIPMSSSRVLKSSYLMDRMIRILVYLKTWIEIKSFKRTK